MCWFYRFANIPVDDEQCKNEDIISNKDWNHHIHEYGVCVCVCVTVKVFHIAALFYFHSMDDTEDGVQ